MNYYQIFYSYILPPIAFLSLLYIIYLLSIKRAYFKYIEDNFEKAVKRNFEEMQYHMNQMIEKLNADAREKLEETLSSFQKINKAQKYLNYKLQELQKANEELHNEIKKRDAIIERKTKQIKRLKNEI